MSELVDVRVVQEAGDAPMAFLWRGRLYVVREVLGHWRERREWWSTAAARALHGEDRPGRRPMSSEGPSFADWSGDPAGTTGELPGRVPGGAHGPAPRDACASGPDWSHSGESRGIPADHPNSTGAAEPAHEFLLDSECEVWRVEASTGRAFGNGVYDLSRTPASQQSADSWRLLQIAD